MDRLLFFSSCCASAGPHSTIQIIMIVKILTIYTSTANIVPHPSKGPKVWIIRAQSKYSQPRKFCKMKILPTIVTIPNTIFSPWIPDGILTRAHREYSWSFYNNCIQGSCPNHPPLMPLRMISMRIKWVEDHLLLFFVYLLVNELPVPHLLL